MQRTTESGYSKTIKVSDGRHHLTHPIAMDSGPFGDLGHFARVLVAADVENLVYSARDLGRMVNFRGLACKLRSHHPAISMHAYFSAPGSDDRSSLALKAMDWEPHPREIIRQCSRGQQKLLANADHAFAFGVAAELARGGADACLLGTGDGVLALDVARSIRRLFPRCKFVATLSVGGATSRLLDARKCVDIDCNMELGADVMPPWTMINDGNARRMN